MSERREWWVRDDHGLEVADKAYRKEQDNCIHVREVLPGDVTTIKIDWSDHLKQHAALVEAVTECLQIVSLSSWDDCEHESKEEKATKVYVKLLAALAATKEQSDE